MSNADILDRFTAEQLLTELRARKGAAAFAPATVAAPDLPESIESAEIADKVRDDQNLIYGSDDGRDLFDVMNPSCAPMPEAW